MATAPERLTTIANALTNATATAAIKAKLGQALAWRFGRFAEYQSGNAADKARIAMDCELALHRTLIDELNRRPVDVPPPESELPETPE